jgi:hypothetical protein
VFCSDGINRAGTLCILVCAGVMGVGRVGLELVSVIIALAVIGPEAGRLRCWYFVRSDEQYVFWIKGGFFGCKNGKLHYWAVITLMVVLGGLLVPPSFLERIKLIRSFEIGFCKQIGVLWVGH